MTDTQETKGTYLETDEHRYLRHTRNAAVTIAVIMIIGVIGAVITGIIEVVILHGLTSDWNNMLSQVSGGLGSSFGSGLGG